MAYDLQLAARVGELLADQTDMTERKMFGGLTFMLRGNFCCGVVKDELCVRVGDDAYDAALARPYVRVMDFTGRPMPGWVFVASDALRTEVELDDWVGQGVRYALALPAK